MQFAIRHASTCRGPTCPVTGKDAPATGWVLALDRTALHADSYEQVPEQLRKLHAEVVAADPAEHSFGIFATAAVQNSTCPADGFAVDAYKSGPFVIAGIAPGGDPRAFGLDAAWRLAPTLADILSRRELFPQKPLPPVIVPPKPPEPTAEQRRAERRHRAIVQVASTMANTQPGEREIRRAEMLLAAIKDFLAGAS